MNTPTVMDAARLRGGATDSLRLFAPLSLIVAIVLVLCGLAPSALANTGHGFSSSFGAAGEGAGELSSPAGVAVDNSTGPAAGDVYVADSGNHRVDVFNAKGEFQFAFGANVGPLGEATCTTLSKCKAGTSGSEPGEFETPSFIAVDGSSGPSSGDVYVADTGTGLVQKFTSSGALVESWGDQTPTPDGVLSGVNTTYGHFGVGAESIYGIAVDATGNLWLLTWNTEMYEFNDESALLTQWPVGSGDNAAGIAVDPAGNLYIVNNGSVYSGKIGTPEVEKFTASGESLGVVNVTTSAIAVDPVADALYVESGEHVEHYSVSCQAVACPVGDTFGQTHLSGGDGLAASGATGAVYATNRTAGTVDLFTVGIEAVTSPASEVLARSVTLNGEVNPTGGELAECEFEYGTSTEYGQRVPCKQTPAAIGSGASPKPVSAEIAGLQGGTTYHFRLVAGRETPAKEKLSVDGEDEQTTTLPVPIITGAASSNLTVTAADLSAEVNPEGVELLACRFEYGTSTSYGSSTPCVPGAGSIPADSSEHAVTAHIADLTENATYHWRLVVQGVNGTTTGIDHTFVYATTGEGLPDNRAYEMVSPPQKNAALLDDVNGSEPQIADDGSRMVAVSIGCFADATACTALRNQSNGEPFAFTRTSSGWTPSALTPPASQFEGSSQRGTNPNTGTALFQLPTPPGGDDWYARTLQGSLTDLGPYGPGTNQAEEHDEEGNGRVSTADLSHLAFEGAAPLGSLWPFDATKPGRKDVYEDADASGMPPLLVGVNGGYENGENRHLISTCGTVLAQPGGMSADGRIVFFEAHAGDALEQCSGPPVEELYARVDGELPDAHTVAISEPRAFSSTAPDNSCVSAECQKNITETVNWRRPAFAGISEDGSKAFFTSEQQLTDGAAQSAGQANSCPESGSDCNLYLYDLAGSPGESLFDASSGAPAPTVLGVVGVSANGTHAYFVANGVLTGAANSQGSKAAPGNCRNINGEKDVGTCNLYMYERDAAHPDGYTAFIATVPATDTRNWFQSGGQQANVTPDGDFMVFVSHGDLTPDEAREEGPAQVYRYDAQTGSLARVSIGRHGFNDNGNAGALGTSEGSASNGHTGDAGIVTPGDAGAGRLGPKRGDPTMSDDGTHVFFQSPVALTPKALNDVVADTEKLLGGRGESTIPQVFYAQNVYEWEQEGVGSCPAGESAGCVSLISDGRDTSLSVSRASFQGESAVRLLGSDTTGANVFFTTADQLVPQDIDTQLDIYDARVCTASDPCIPPLAPVPAPCLGEACHGIPAATPSLLTPGSASFNGAGNLTPTAPVTKALTRAKKLDRALALCHRDKKKPKRQACERQARQKYGAKKKSKKPGNNRRAK
jgi:NHL repeat